MLFCSSDIIYNGEMNEKIKLLYRLHIPPGKLIFSNIGIIHMQSAPDFENLIKYGWRRAIGNMDNT